MATKLGRIETYLEGLLTIKTHSYLITWPSKVRWQTKIISTTRVPMATKPDRISLSFSIREKSRRKVLLLYHLVRYINWLDAILDDLQTRPLRQILLILQNNSLAFLKLQIRWQLTVAGSYWEIQMAFWYRGLGRSRDKLELLYLHSHSTYGHQNS